MPRRKKGERPISNRTRNAKLFAADDERVSNIMLNEKKTESEAIRDLVRLGLELRHSRLMNKDLTTHHLKEAQKDVFREILNPFKVMMEGTLEAMQKLSESAYEHVAGINTRMDRVDAGYERVVMNTVIIRAVVWHFLLNAVNTYRAPHEKVSKEQFNAAFNLHVIRGMIEAKKRYVLSNPDEIERLVEEQTELLENPEFLRTLEKAKIRLPI